MEEEIKKSEEIEVPEVVTWETPILIILCHHKFDEFLRVEIAKARNTKPGPGHILDPAMLKTLETYNPVMMKYHYPYILNKSSMLPAAHRHWIEYFIQQTCFQLITYYEKQNGSNKTAQ